mgnify:CR=1 FL=1
MGGAPGIIGGAPGIRSGGAPGIGGAPVIKDGRLAEANWLWRRCTVRCRVSMSSVYLLLISSSSFWRSSSSRTNLESSSRLFISTWAPTITSINNASTKKQCVGGQEMKRCASCASANKQISIQLTVFEFFTALL